MTIQKLLTIKHNDYTETETSFKQKTGVDIKRAHKEKIPLTKNCTIVIPFFSNSHLLCKKCLLSLQHQALSNDYKRKNIEIIIVNDGSPIDLKKTIKQTNISYPITYLRLKKNYGRSTARNLGLLYARNEIIIFLDSDIIVHKHFLKSHLIRHEFINNCTAVGFHHKVNFRNPIIKLSNLKKGILKMPNYRKDFRYKKFVPNEWKNIYTDIPSKNFNKTYYPLNASNYFKDFGKGKILGVWDLPFMFLTGNASVPKQQVLRVGAFDMRFRGWGLEDVHLGAKLIASGLYLIPNIYATAYHVKRKEQKSTKIKEYKSNFRLYTRLKRENLPCFEEKQWKTKMRRVLKNKIHSEIQFIP